MTEPDDRQRLRQRTVQGAKGRDPWRDTHPGMFTPWVGGVLAMESLLTEAEATIATQAKEIERLRCLFNDAAAFDEAGQPGDGMYVIQKELGAYDE